jgi:hypothetical protein
MKPRHAERLADWWATLSPDQRGQAVAALRALPRRDYDDADDAWRHLVPRWESVTALRPMDVGEHIEPEPPGDAQGRSER